MGKINLIKPDSDLRHLKRPMGWDLELNNKPYDIYWVGGFIHSYGGRWGDNCFWACPADEKPSYGNMIPFSGFAPEWGIHFDQANYVKYKWDEVDITQSSVCWIMRNGEKFLHVAGRDMAYALSKAQYQLVELQEGPIEVNQRDWKEKLAGRKIYYREQPAIIEYVTDSNQLWVIPDNENSRFIAHIAIQNEEHYDPEDDEYAEGLMLELLSPHISWFRD